MCKAINDATLQQAGLFYQYLIAIKDCFELKEEDVLQIELHGDVSIINNSGGVYQKEVKHHFGDKNLSDRDIDFWKTLANWYTDYERAISFSQLILCTTANVSASSPFSNWNTLKKEEKLEIICNIGRIKKEKEETFRGQYNRIFNDSYDQEHLLNILDRFSIVPSQTSLSGISCEFSKYLRPIPESNRDNYIGALLGRILNKIKNPPHRWEVTKNEFDEICQTEAVAYGVKGSLPLPNEFAKSIVPAIDSTTFEQKRFVKAIQEIEYDSEIQNAVSDYWKTNMTIAKYFKDNLMYCESLDEYVDVLFAKLRYTKSSSEIDAKGVDCREKLKISKKLYNGVMQWDAKDFGTIVRNQEYFQRGVIHNIVDETDFTWKVGVEKDEYE